MKKLFLSVALTGIAVCAFAQGNTALIALDNLSNGGAATDTTGGRFFLNTGSGPALTSGDFNAAFYGGTDSTSLSLINSFSGANAAGDSAGPGLFLDPTGNTWAVPGTTSTSTTAFFRIEAWTGNFASYAAAVAANAAAGTSAVFSNPVFSGANQPVDLISMPSITMGAVPEPSTFALAGLGAAALLIFRRRK